MKDKNIIKADTPVVITDVRYRMSLCIIRSLGKKGIKIITAESKSTASASALGFYSKYSNDKLLLSDADKDKDAYINDLINYSISIKQKPVLIPVGIHSIMSVSSNKERLEPYYHFVIPDLECINIANDTNSLIKIAQQAGVPVPLTTTLQPDEAVTELSKRISYPVVIKYRQGELLKLGPEKRYKIIYKAEDFANIFTQMHNIQEYPLVQEYISGDGFGVSAIFDKEGNPVEVFCHRRLREYPITGGPSCLCESFWNKQMADYAIKLLKALKWQGVAMVEFKGQPDGRLALMEINPRIWGSFPLTVAAGLDFPYAMYQTALQDNAGIHSLNLPNYKTSKKMRYILQDLMSFKGYLRAKSNKLAFALSYIRDLLNPRISEGVFDIRDMKASLQYYKQALKKYNK